MHEDTVGTGRGKRGNCNSKQGLAFTAVVKVQQELMQHSLQGLLQDFLQGWMHDYHNPPKDLALLLSWPLASVYK